VKNTASALRAAQDAKVTTAARDARVLLVPRGRLAQLDLQVLRGGRVARAPLAKPALREILDGLVSRVVLVRKEFLAH
jgi:hypothetical protein